ncbi:mRNA binding protein pumilio [Colletotrichum sojae]|uniref:Pumilio homology domain family member 3 n=1 Tax=Colletotrichum sojae TaxID=2175907 RepID=A0A8H6MJV1_9PEZI|nr:mRNA binding protein pumilio [Colletotrichum sojae]
MAPGSRSPTRRSELRLDLASFSKKLALRFPSPFPRLSSSSSLPMAATSLTCHVLQGRPGLYQSYQTMPNGRDENAAPAVPSNYASNLYDQNIWPSSFTTAGKREPVNARGTEDAYTTQPSGSGALAANSEADTWNNQSPWNPDGTQTRSGSGNTSPNRTRDSLHNASSYYFNGGRPKSYLDEDKESGGYGTGFNGAFGPTYTRHEKRGSKDPAFMNLGVVGAPSRDGSIPPSRQSDENPSPPSYRDTFTGYGHTPSNSVASTRPIGPSHSSSFPSQPSNSRALLANSRQMDDSDLAVEFKKSLTLDEGSGLAKTIAGGAPGFQFNPGSQPWRGDVNGANGAFSIGGDSYADSMPLHFPVKRASNSISGGPGVYRAVTSPKSFAPQSTEMWARPPSRDLRMVQDGDRRTPVPPFMSTQAPTFYPHYYGANFPGAYPQMFDPYQRPALPISGYGLQLAPYQTQGSMPVRPGKDQDPGKGVRSALLEDFRTSSKSNKRYELRDIYNYVVEFSGDQHGSRFIQQKLETANSDEKDQVFREIEPNAIQLMKDVFGNYVIQKFFEHGNQVQKKMLASQMKGKVVDLSMQMYACRVVQKALEHVLVEQQAELVKELQPDILKVVKDQNGNHVIQKIIELVPRHHIDFIMDCFRGQVSVLASHMYACRVIQRMLEHGTEQDKECIMAELHNSTQNLITDQYGNYVVQHIIEHGKPEDRSRVIQLVTAQLFTLSKHKFASNVVEKCIERGTAEERTGLVEQVTSQSEDGPSSLQLVMKDQYGNYVIQKLLHELKGEERMAFVEELKPQFAILRKSSNSRQVAAIDRLMSAAEKPGGSQADANSAAPTPVLTMEPNSPQSSSPPSTNASAIGEIADDDNKSAVPGGVSLNVQVEEA